MKMKTTTDILNSALETNLKFSKTEDFKKLCENASIKVTTRQASKFRNQKGIAYKIKNGLASQLKKGQPGYQNYNA